MPTLGATAEDVAEAAALITGGNATHYWEDSGIVGKLYEKTLGIDGVYAWEVWLVYQPGALWNDTYPPKPDFAMHQLRSSKAEDIMPYLDSKRFASVVTNYLEEMPKKSPATP